MVNQAQQSAGHGGVAGIQTRSAEAGSRSGSQQSSAASAAAAFPVLLNDDQAAACLGVSVRKFHDLRKEEWMPRPVVLGPRMLRWPRAEIEAAVATMPRLAEAGPEPAQLRRAKIERMKSGASA